MAVIEYSVLGYYPSAISGEKINVGILFHELDPGRRTFYVMKNWERLEKFDNELDIPFFKKYLTGIKRECEGDIFSIDDGFSITDYIKSYSNELRFDFVKKSGEVDPDQFMDEMEKLYMRLDFSKEERLSKEHESQVAKPVLKEQNLVTHSQANEVRRSF